MATDTSTIYNQIADAASAETALADLSPNPDTADLLRADLSSGSKVSPWRTFAWVVAYVNARLRDLFDLYKVEVVELAKDGHFGTRRWFVSKAKAFQYGHALVLTDLDGGYAVDDPAARIVAQAACVELANQVIVKVAKQVGAGLGPLTTPEVFAVNDYFQTLRPPVTVTVLTAEADKLRLSGAVVYDAELILTGIQAGVQAAIDDYLRTLEFGGVMRLTDLKAAMLAVTGVVDVRLDLAEARTTGAWTQVSRIYYSYAGHMALDAGFPIATTMNWQAGSI